MSIFKKLRYLSYVDIFHINDTEKCRRYTGNISYMDYWDYFRPNYAYSKILNILDYRFFGQHIEAPIWLYHHIHIMSNPFARLQSRFSRMVLK